MFYRKQKNCDQLLLTNWFLLILLFRGSLSTTPTTNNQEEIKSYFDDFEHKIEVKVMQKLYSYIHDEIQLVKSEIYDQIESFYKEDHIQILLEENAQLKSKYEVLAAQIQNIMSNEKSNFKENNNMYNRMNNIPRSCSEILYSDPLAKSGNYYIDPDGTDVGDDPIFVFCDMAKLGTTIIGHDNEAKTDVGNCNDPGCYTRQFNYNATAKQLQALIDISDACHQSIIYDCFIAPFELNGIQQSWWNDREGVKRYFWAGNPSNNEHICQCGIDGSCIDSSLKCNCDSTSRLQLLTDSGILTNKDLLPVSALNFGRIPPGSNGKYTLGKLECSGRVAPSIVPTDVAGCYDMFLLGQELSGFYLVSGGGTKIKVVYCDYSRSPLQTGYEIDFGYVYILQNDYKKQPTSCQELFLIGHQLSGFYQIKAAGGTKIKTVYCDFNHIPGTAGYQVDVGYNDMKTKISSNQETGVYFSVRYVVSGSTNPVRFSGTVSNIGGGMNAGTGIFTAPVSGTYFFTVQGNSESLPSRDSDYMDLTIRKNGEVQAFGSCANEYKTRTHCSASVTLILNRGDQVTVVCIDGEKPTRAEFSGYLLEESLAL